MIRKYKYQVRQISEDYKLIVGEYENLTKRYEKMSQESKAFKNTNEKLNNEILHNNKLNNMNNSIIGNKPLSVDYQILESKLLLLSKQKKHLENIINK